MGIVLGGTLTDAQCFYVILALFSAVCLGFVVADFWCEVRAAIQRPVDEVVR